MPNPLPDSIRKAQGCPPGYFLVKEGVTRPGDIYINCFNEWAPSMHPGTPITMNNWTQYARPKPKMRK